MKIFLDTANLEELRKGMALGVVDGVTTNPTLVSKENAPFREHILEICKIMNGGIVNAEVVSTDFDGILREAHELASWHPDIVVKIPMIPEGVRALSQLSKEGIRVNITLVFSAVQALLVAKAGAYIVSPFVGRLDDIAEDGLVLLRDIMTIYRANNFKTQVLAASLRHPIHVLEAAKIGTHIGTMPYKVFDQLFHHPLTDRGLEGFLHDWEKARAVLGNIMQPAAASNAGR